MIDPTHANIINNAQQKRIITAIQQQEGKPELNIKFEIATKSTDCPQHIRQARHIVKLAAAKQKVRVDPHILALQQHFSATILEDSIKVCED